MHALAFVAACVASGMGCAQASAPATAKDVPYPGTFTLEVDLREAPRRIYCMHETIPVSPGPLPRYYPKWPLPDHAPDGAIANIAGPVITANGKPVPWRRDVEDMYTLSLDVPPGPITSALLSSTHRPGRASGTATRCGPRRIRWTWIRPR